MRLWPYNTIQGGQDNMKEFFVLQFWKYLPTDKLKMWWLSEGPYKLFKKPLYDQKTMDWAKKMCQELELSEDK